MMDDGSGCPCRMQRGVGVVYVGHTGHIQGHSVQAVSMRDGYTGFMANPSQDYLPLAGIRVSSGVIVCVCTRRGASVRGRLVSIGVCFKAHTCTRALICTLICTAVAVAVR